MSRTSHACRTAATITIALVLSCALQGCGRKDKSTSLGATPSATPSLAEVSDTQPHRLVCQFLTFFQNFLHSASGDDAHGYRLGPPDQENTFVEDLGLAATALKGEASPPPAFVNAFTVLGNEAFPDAQGGLTTEQYQQSLAAATSGVDACKAAGLV